jgi:hypothetical protein
MPGDYGFLYCLDERQPGGGSAVQLGRIACMLEAVELSRSGEGFDLYLPGWPSEWDDSLCGPHTNRIDVVTAQLFC